MLASKTTSLLWLYIYIKPTSPSPKQSTMLYSSQVLRLNFLPWDAASTKHATKTTSQKLSLSPILFTQRNTSSIVRHTHFNCIRRPSLANCDYSSCLKWRFHKDVDKDTKSFNSTPVFPCKISWDFCRKLISDNIIKQWKMRFQASDGKGNNFLDLLDNDFNTIEPLYIQGGPWLQAFSHSNSLCDRATRAITNHAPIGEYHLRFFPNEHFSCPCNDYPIETRQHILYECQRFNRYWNPRRNSLSHFILFLTLNPKAFAFE